MQKLTIEELLKWLDNILEKFAHNKNANYKKLESIRARLLAAQKIAEALNKIKSVNFYENGFRNVPVKRHIIMNRIRDISDKALSEWEKANE